MIIECLGTRGSIARGSSQFTRYGGDTISILVTASSGDTFIVDAGTGIIESWNSISKECDWENPKDLHIFFTHYHIDHILGIPFFKPIFNKNQKITMYGPKLEGTDDVRSTFDKMMRPPYSPISFDGLSIKANFIFKTIDETTIEIGSMKITSIGINHTNHGGLGYKFEENGKTFILLTDNELRFPHKNAKDFSEFVDFCSGADLLFHDAQYCNSEYETVKGWGHSTIEDVVELGEKSKCKRVGFLHYSPERTDDEIDKLYKNVKSSSSTEFFPLRQDLKFNI